MAQDLKQKFNIKLPSVPSTNDRELYRELLVVYNSIRLLANSLEKSRSFPILFGDTMAVNTLVNINDSAGSTVARLSQYGVNECRGFVSVPAAAGSIGEVTLIGYFDFETPIGVPIGSRLWASATPGAIAGASPGVGSQRIGYTLSPTRVWFQPNWIP